MSYTRPNIVLLPLGAQKSSDTPKPSLHTRNSVTHVRQQADFTQSKALPVRQQADFSLLTFLRNHKPKADDTKVYLSRPKLSKYVLISNKANASKRIADKSALKPRKVWIRYVPHSLRIDDNYDEHIKAGGILLAVGRIERGEFTKCKPELCTHLILKYHDVEDKIYMIKLSHCYVFARTIKPKIQIDLVDDQVTRMVEDFLKKVPKFQASSR